MNYPYFQNPYQMQGYQPQMTQQAAPQNSDDRIWVANQTAAEAYLVAPGGFVRLWDSNKPVFYERRADATGRPMHTIVYKYTQIDAEVDAAGKNMADYVQKDDLKPLVDRITALEKSLTGGKIDDDK